jgi:S-ribosylhomocysteine lyase
MGCRTGFYLLVRDERPETVLENVITVLEKIVSHDGEMFGATRKECGNYRELDLDAAKREAKAYLEELKERKHDFLYPEK